MREEVLDILRTAARKLATVRSAEAAAVTATTAGACAAVAQVAWLIAWPRPLAATLLCLLPAAAGAALLARRALGRALGLSRRTAAVVAVICLAIAAMTAAMVLTGRHLDVPQWALPLALIPAGAIVGAAATWIAGVSIRRAAVYLDQRGRFGERLSTAAELAESDQRDQPYAHCVYAQARDAIRRAEPAQLAMWRRGRPTVGALGLVVLLCGVLCFVRPAGPAEFVGRLQAAADQLKTMSASRRARLAEALREAARELPDDPVLTEQLLAGAKAVEVGDDESLRRAAAAMEQRLREAGRGVSGPAAEKLLAAAGAGRDERPARDNGSPRRAPRTAPARSRVPETIRGETVRVYHPDYAKLVGPDGAIGTGAGAEDSAAFLDRDRAWTLARERAAGALAEGQVPTRYRGLVRAFFDTDPVGSE